MIRLLAWVVIVFVLAASLSPKTKVIQPSESVEFVVSFDSDFDLLGHELVLGVLQPSRLIFVSWFSCAKHFTYKFVQPSIYLLLQQLRN